MLRRRITGPTPSRAIRGSGRARPASAEPGGWMPSACPSPDAGSARPSSPRRPSHSKVLTGAAYGVRLGPLPLGRRHPHFVRPSPHTPPESHAWQPPDPCRRAPSNPHASGSVSVRSPSSCTRRPSTLPRLVRAARVARQTRPRSRISTRPPFCRGAGHDRKENPHAYETTQ